MFIAGDCKATSLEALDHVPSRMDVRTERSTANAQEEVAENQDPWCTQEARGMVKPMARRARPAAASIIFSQSG